MAIEVTMEIIILLAAVSWLFVCFLIALIAANREIGFGKALLLALILSPIIGAIFVAMSPVRGRSNADAADKSRAEIPKEFEGERDLQSAKYQLFLIRRFGIEKNPTLEKYVLLDNLFNTLADAFDYAHMQYEASLAIISKERASRDARRQQESLASLERTRKIGKAIRILAGCGILFLATFLGYRMFGRGIALDFDAGTRSIGQSCKEHSHCFGTARCEERLCVQKQ